jgi:hypothetical protein
LNNRLGNRPTKEDLEKRNIIRNQETLFVQKQAQKVMDQKDRLKKALMRRPSVAEMTEQVLEDDDGHREVRILYFNLLPLHYCDRISNTICILKR